MKKTILNVNDLQKEIIRSVLLATNSIDEFVSAIYKTFPINTLCQMLSINRNRYYYLKSIGGLDREIMGLIQCL